MTQHSLSNNARGLFSDAELAEHAAEDFVGADFTEDGAEFADGVAKVLCEEFCG